MSQREEEFLKSLREAFKVEAGEHLQTIAAGLLQLEQSPAQEERKRQVDTIFRAAHSLKGAARAVNFLEIERICQTLEDLFALWKRQASALSSQALDRAHRAVNEVSRLVASGGASRPPAPAATAQPATANAPAAPVKPPLPPPFARLPERREPAAPTRPSTTETVRISVAKLDAQLLEAEEMLAAKLAARQHAADLEALAVEFDTWQKEWARVEPELRAFRQMAGAPIRGAARVAEFLEWNHGHLRLLANKFNQLKRAAGQDQLIVGKLVDDLLEDSKKLLMLPAGTLAALFPKLVRDLCHDQGKEADLIVRGEEAEVDKRILDEMKDPLVHLLRNCIDHGIESPDERRRQGKPARAAILVAIAPVNGSKIEILVSDDGAGIDVGKVKESAVKHGLISAESAARLDDASARDLIFQGDISTSPIITELSGRGLGLAIVREKVEKLGGRVAVESRRHAGTTFRIELPVTLATFRGILVEAAGRQFVVPTAGVERVVRFRPAEIQTVEGRETLVSGGRATPLVPLADVLELPPAKAGTQPAAAQPAFIVGVGDQRVAFVVDAVLDEQEVLVKRLGKPLSRIRNFAGATVLGGGQVAPVLHVSDLLKSAKKSGAGRRVVPAEAAAETASRKSVLVVEDSITSRMLLKGVLEAAGYNVKTAVDGMEGFTTLRAEPFDLVISDVEMPRLNGFDLTARIRAEKKYAEIPVILVTALESREDRERGVDAGASAYLVKSNFDQSNLLETVRRLV